MVEALELVDFFFDLANHIGFRRLSTERLFGKRCAQVAAYLSVVGSAAAAAMPGELYCTAQYTVGNNNNSCLLLPAAQLI